MRPLVSNPQHVTGAQRAIVDQSTQDRDPADDSGELDDPNAMVETYPAAFDAKIEEAEKAIESETGNTALTDETTGVHQMTDRA
ncbi:MAG: hypothetical protein ABJA16_09885 [Nakamurella sp.]